MPGYEGIGAGKESGFLPPPVPLQPVAPAQPGPTPEEWNIPALSEDVAREAFKDYVQSQCCYQSGPANEGVITNMESFNTYRLRLETFTESRSTEMAEKPYEGETADFYTQPAPTPWEVQTKTPELFTKHTEEVRVPYTSNIKVIKQCNKCNGSGKNEEENCTDCNGTGKDRCSKCSGAGKKKCETCKGKKKLLTFIKLKVEWANHVDNHVVEQNSGLKAEELNSVNGKELHKMTQIMVYPLYGFPNPAIVEASDRLIKEHQSKYAQTSRILQQRQTVELIPVTKVNYKWKSSIHIFYVYGKENKVNTDNYPETCCCVIL
uniref:Ssu-2 homolog n=1 Tax=Xiphophorus couchianus TaxID=32473 RepID=A0A3B5M5V9_9TELE